jgi:lysophospholipase L1-like esterase
LHGRMRQLTLLVLVACGAIAAGATPARAAKGPIQLSLGDSWAIGFGAQNPAEGGYVPQVFEALRKRLDCVPGPRKGCDRLRLRNISVGGASTPTLISDQLPEAEELLEDRNSDRRRRNDVRVVTISIGGNDVVAPIIAACFGGYGPECQETIDSEFADYRDDLDRALRKIRNAAGQRTQIVLGTYDNSIGACSLGANNPERVSLADEVLEGSARVGDGLHDIMRGVGSNHDVVIADSFGKLNRDDWVGGSDCLHPVDSGYDKVTRAFLRALGFRQGGGGGYPGIY